MSTATLRELLQTAYGVKTAINVNPEVAQVETTVTKILSYNPNRLGIVISVIGAANVLVAPDNNVSLTRGILLNAAGGSYTLEWDTDFEAVSNEWFAIASGAASAIYVQEIVAVP